MGRKLRFVPPGHMVEVTTRTFQGRYLLRPTAGLREIVVGILARAKERHGVSIHAFAFLSNHYHLLLSPPDAHKLALFVGYLNTNLSKEAGRLHRWKGKMFDRRYSAVVVLKDEVAQIARLEYVLSQSCKEGLVARPTDWPGAHSAAALLSGRASKGIWFDRTREYAARLRCTPNAKTEFPAIYELDHDPIPCWAHLSSKPRQMLVQEILSRITAQATRERIRRGQKLPTRRALLRQKPSYRPKSLKWSPIPKVHASSRRSREDFLKAYGAFLRAFRRAARQIREGEGEVRFPEGSFPPPQPFSPHPVPT